MLFNRQTEGSLLCTSCGVLVGVNDDACYNCGRRNPGLWGYAPVLRRLGQDLGFVPLVIGATVTLYVLSLLLSRSNLQMMLAPSTQILFLLGASGAVPVFGFGRWWTLLTAGWLHGGVLHVLFNVLWIRQLGPAVADLYGPGRMVIIYTLSGVSGFAVSSLAGAYLGGMPIPMLRGAQFTVGASASIFGLLGAMVHYGRRTGSSHIGQAGLQYALLQVVFGLFFPGIDNYAHLGGFAGGYLASSALDPLKPERVDHMIVALVCLALTALALVASFVTALPLLLQE
ncbi:MAG: rhomboid family intramembrane serine protease [Vicinamibacterales bacterium]